MKGFSKKDFLKYVGDMSQLFGVKDYRLIGGRANGVRAVDIKNGSGIEFTVLPDRCLDISNFSFKGLNYGYMTKSGIVAPQYYDREDLEFLRSFYAGFLTTCGLRYMGAPCSDDGEELGLHGRISNTPAEEVYAGTEWTEEGPVMKIKGKMREARLFAENLVLEREIICKYGENIVYINDSVENLGHKEETFMLLYHFNMGYPLLSSKSYMIAPSLKVTPMNSEAEKGIGEYNICQMPVAGFNEQVFLHDLKTDEDGNTFAAMVNPVQEQGVAIWFNKNQLGMLTQWKQMGEGDYVFGIEPCNATTEGRAKNRSEGRLEFIKPGEVRKFNLKIEMIDGKDRINQLASLT